MDGGRRKKDGRSVDPAGTSPPRKSRERGTTTANSVWRIVHCRGDNFLEEPCSGIQPTHGQSGFLPNPHLHLVGPRSSSIIGSPEKAHVVPRSQVNSASAGSKAYTHTASIFPSTEAATFIQSSLEPLPSDGPSPHVSHGWRSHSPTVCGQVVFCDFPSLPA